MKLRKLQRKMIFFNCTRLIILWSVLDNNQFMANALHDKIKASVAINVGVGVLDAVEHASELKQRDTKDCVQDNTNRRNHLTRDGKIDRCHV
jgi:uncharacterized protein (UPF0210 family)